MTNNALKPCEFCKDNNADQTWDGGGAHDFRISQNGLYYYDEQLGWEGMEINYCPMCGRKLEEPPCNTKTP